MHLMMKTPLRTLSSLALSMGECAWEVLWEVLAVEHAMEARVPIAEPMGEEEEKEEDEEAAEGMGRTGGGASTPPATWYLDGHLHRSRLCL